MAPDGDAEIQTSATEQSPLLGDQPQAQQDVEEPPPKAPAPRRAAWYLWRMFWTLVAALIIAVFVKGWIDAGADADVCVPEKNASCMS